MEELKELVSAVAGLPNAAMWVVAALLTYKVSVLISIYGTIRFVVSKAVEAYIKAKDVQLKPKELNVGNAVISEAVSSLLLAQIARISNSGYIHASDVQRLAATIDKMKETKQ